MLRNSKAIDRLMLRALLKANASDKEIWRSDEDGRHYKIETETGEIKAGFGGRLNGAEITQSVTQSNRQSRNISSRDVRNEYSKNAKAGVGTITRQSGEKQHNKQHELDTAQNLVEQIGGDVVMLDNSGRSPVRDCIWQGKTWEIKKATTPHAAGKRVEIGLTQIEKTGGNLILDCQTDEYDEAEKNALAKLKALAVPPLDVVLMHRGKIKKILRFT